MKDRKLQVEKLEDRSVCAGVPALSSLPGAYRTLVLDFDGNYTSNWLGYRNISSPQYDSDNRTGFSQQDVNNIKEIWARVSEDYAPFNVNVTTIDPGHLTNGRVAKMVIGGSSGWLGNRYAGVATLGGFYNNSPNIGFVFTDNLGKGNPAATADTIAHESGHLFGLNHQSLFVNGRFSKEYNPGSNGWAPIMGAPWASITTWHNGLIKNGWQQDDMSILGSVLGWKNNTAGITMQTATNLGTLRNLSRNGLIIRTHQYNWFKFTTNGGTATFNVNGIPKGTNLDSVLELRDSSGRLISINNPTDKLSSSITKTLAKGDYYLVIRSNGQYGRVGQYTLNISYINPLVNDLYFSSFNEKDKNVRKAG